MSPKLVPVLVLILCALLLGAGCAAPTGGGGGTQGGTQGTSGGGQETAVTLPPGPVVTVPPIYEVEIQENRNHNTLHPDITVTFRGGKGQYILRNIVVTVSRSDGQVIQKAITPTGGDQYSVGDYVTIPGTTGKDQVVVVVTILGKQYKIIDMTDDFNSHP